MVVTRGVVLTNCRVTLSHVGKIIINTSSRTVYATNAMFYIGQFQFAQRSDASGIYDLCFYNCIGFHFWHTLVPCSPSRGVYIGTNGAPIMMSFCVDVTECGSPKSQRCSDHVLPSHVSQATFCTPAFSHGQSLSPQTTKRPTTSSLDVLSQPHRAYPAHRVPAH